MEVQGSITNLRHTVCVESHYPRWKYTDPLTERVDESLGFHMDQASSLEPPVTGSVIAYLAKLFNKAHMKKLKSSGFLKTKLNETARIISIFNWRLWENGEPPTGLMIAQTKSSKLTLARPNLHDIDTCMMSNAPIFKPLRMPYTSSAQPFGYNPGTGPLPLRSSSYKAT
ncbi:uncharacterized protein BJ212DRAFT_1301141 [Suillus subaureus]|uniref:Uncharacterized protein n=1 Tax=Suillus subaureus TaxID=48587 RepID=A0A9P7E700_9AGAM|nr:uncharacterized protein BJ212DRAFT_1301141 [Suillus subaureus]KAG1813229.1 hypothetical protein BJ212DRAFT_1301141 [Suillus subaureus]